MTKISIAAVGDCCVDVYPQLKRSFLGGTSFNICATAAKQKLNPTLVSAVGTDPWGKAYRSACNQLGINNHLSVFSGKTSHVKINLDKNNSPQFSAWQLGVLKKFSLNNIHEKLLQAQDISVCVAIKPLEKIFKQFCQMDLPTTFKAADFDGTTPYTFADQVIGDFAPRLNLIVKSTTDKSTIKLLKSLSVKHNLMALITLGNQGSQVFSPAQDYFFPAIKTQVTDTTGAGDAYLATFLINYWQSKNIPNAMAAATRIAAEKVTRFGAST